MVFDPRTSLLEVISGCVDDHPFIPNFAGGIPGVSLETATPEDINVLQVVGETFVSERN